MKENPRKISYAISLIVHAVLIIVFAFINLSVGSIEEDYVTIGFGSGLSSGSKGPLGTDEITAMDRPKQEEVKKEEQQKVELPKSKSFDEENVITKTDKKSQKDLAIEKIKPISDNKEKVRGTEDAGEGIGGFGFELDFGGKGIRKIYSYVLPEYPEGVSKEIDVKLKFTILPDGTVGKIFPLIKADARLEMAAINSLRQWRFEPLPPNAKQVEQTAIITFPYRLQ
ncbi:MAG: energy transducer TonB [Melioribacter sp.]|nr:energy transducer TonB [Melioribacter sp.]